MQFAQRTQFVKPAMQRGQRGVSLIEILIALVILVLGILSLIRLFPGGFLVVRSAENSTFADRLGQAAVESLKNNGGGLPDGIYTSYTNANGIIQFDPNVRPDNLGPYTPPPGTGVSDPFSDDINKARYISNETITIPAGHVVNNTLNDPIHVINFGPIFLNANASPATINDVPGVFEANLSVVSVPWTMQIGDSRPNINDENRAIDDPSAELSAGQTAFLVDYAAGKIAVPSANYQQAFTLTFKTPSPMGNGFPSQSQTIHLLVPKTYNGDWFPLATYINPLNSPVPASPWIVNSATLVREFHCINTPQSGYVPFSNRPMPELDPYEYALVNANFAQSGGGYTNANIGTLAFNPLAAGGNGRAPLQARISYLAYDWHIIREDRDVADGSTIRLTLNGLKKIGDPLTFPDNRVSPSSGIYPGLIANASNAQDIFLLDEDSGVLRPLSPADINDGDDNTNNPNILNISYKNGRIILPTNPTDAKFKGGHLRIFYAGDLDWGVAVQKASTVYQPHLDMTTGNAGPPTSSDPAQPGALHVGEYFVVGDDIYFPLCDAGKTVEFDGVRYMDGNNTQQTVSDVVQAIPDVSVPVNGVDYVRINASQLGLANYQTGMTSNLSFSAVRGISARAVVIWRERGDWKTRNVDTLLTRTQ